MSLFILKTLSWFPVSLSNDKVSSDILSLITSLLISQSQYLSHFFPPSASHLGKQRYGGHLKEILDSLRFILTISSRSLLNKEQESGLPLDGSVSSGMIFNLTVLRVLIFKMKSHLSGLLCTWQRRFFEFQNGWRNLCDTSILFSFY